VVADPREEYHLRRNRWDAEWKILQRRSMVIGNWRLAIGIAAAVLAYFAFGVHKIPGSALLVPLAVFLAIAIYGARVSRRRTLAERALKFYDQGLARVEDRWPGTGEAGERFRNRDHLYADDLDLFGKGSLFELVSHARTTAGESILADWLMAPADLPTAVARQEAVKELTELLDLREDIALLGEDIRAEVEIEAVTRWGSRPPGVFSNTTRVFVFALALAGIVAVIAFLAQLIPLWPLLTILLCDLVLARVLRERVLEAIRGIDTPATGLRVLSLLLARLQEESFYSPRLKELHSEIAMQGLDAAHRIARLERWVEMLDSSDNVLVRVIQPLVLWREQSAMAIEAWRQVNGRFIGRWIAAIAEIESLSSLASIAYERPSWSYPHLLGSGDVEFDAVELKHPLLPQSRCVPNDVRLCPQTRLLIVSGSNMSGKSTLLRSVGLATVLAWAGCPVPVRTLRTSMWQTAASMRANDSLQDNRSRFFAEISRIRAIVDFACQMPTLFLLDEVLSGTNSHDRKIGAAAIMNKLVSCGAMGLITTHDLALADIEDELRGSAQNVHFDDYISDGTIEFEFKLKPGIVTHSNALELMRSIGLEV
jgi:predicted ATPase